MNLYEWEARHAARFQGFGDTALSWLLIAAALVMIAIALFSHNAVFKALVLAYVILP